MSLLEESGLVIPASGGGEVGGPHRYWRLMPTDVSWTPAGTNDYYQIIHEFRLYSSIDLTGSNVALSSTATARSFVSNFFASLTIDDDNATRWVSQDVDSIPEWMDFDFGDGNDLEIHSLEIYTAFIGYSAKAYDLQHSDNGTAWTTQSSIVTAGDALSETFQNL
jgi:hypothetical protein